MVTPAELTRGFVPAFSSWPGGPWCRQGTQGQHGPGGGVGCGERGALCGSVPTVAAAGGPTVPSGRPVCWLLWPQLPRDCPEGEDHRISLTRFSSQVKLFTLVFNELCVWAHFGCRPPQHTGAHVACPQPLRPPARPGAPREAPQRACLVVISSNLMPSACAPLRRCYTVCEKFPSGPITFWGQVRVGGLFTVRTGSKTGRGRRIT